jgi:MFS family permease
MSVSAALRAALGDFYGQSWRMLVLGSALSAFVVATLVSGLWFTPLLGLLLLAGPFAAAVMHCTVTLVQTDDLSLRDAVTGVRLHWRRGFVLGLLALAAAVATALAVPFYAAMGGLAWPLALVALYLAAVFGVVQLLLWPLAIAERDRPLTEVAKHALVRTLRRPAAAGTFALALLVINAAGLAAALLPFLMLTVGYSFLAAAHFALPRNDPGGATAWRA